MALEFLFAIYTLIGLPEFYRCDPYQVGDYVQVANTVKETLDIEPSVTDRIVNPDISLNANFHPLILERSALSSFTAALQKIHKAMLKGLVILSIFCGCWILRNSLYQCTVSCHAGSQYQ